MLSYAPALVLLAIAIADCGRFADTDLWGHLFFGGMLLHRGPHLGPDPFSYAPHFPQWLHHEWLAEALMAWIYASSGILGLKLWKLACSAATIALLAAAAGEGGAPIAIQFTALLAAAFTLIPYMQFRPLLFSYVFTAATVLLLTRDNLRGRAPLWIAIPGLALWSNLHGSFFIGLGLLGTYAAVRGLTDLVVGKGASRLIRLGMITIASAAASLATPYGIDSWRAVLISIRNPMTRRIMADWRPLLVVLNEQLRQPHGGAIFLWLAIILLAAFALIVALTPRGDDLALVAIAALSSIGALMAVRNVPLALVAVIPVLARHAGLLLRNGVGWKRASDPCSSSGGQPLSGVSQAIVGALAMVVFVETGAFASRIPAAKRYPASAVAFMQAHRLHGNILDYFAWGQYLIWHCSADSKIFIDGRYDLVYPPEVIQQYLDSYENHSRAADVLDHYPHDLVLMPPESPVNALMRSRTDWKLIYRDSTANLYARANTPVAHLPGEPFQGTVAETLFP
ncbi:MAG TPA: hypothetical protein VNU00_10000 [Candidatus Binataceae bacterium]|nr:hypothetical protein [Candidatus Binataceae bacterium]